MKPLALVTLVALLWSACVAASAQTPGLVRNPNEPDMAFAERVLKLRTESDPHVVAAAWNGVPALIVDFTTTTDDETDRPVVALLRQPDGRYRLVQVTVGEEEGGTASVAAIGFAAAAHSGGKAMIVILTWEVQHAIVNGTLYEVRFFAAPRPGQAELTPMAISRRFGVGCECEHTDGPVQHPDYATHYRFQTIAAVKAELKRMGY
jgi:hypothetical protein